MAVSVFDLFKIGMGPSSSHTVGPMRAARQFVARLQHSDLLAQTATVRCWLHGSLGATGKGHASDVAVLLGLSGHEPDTVDVDHIPDLLAEVRNSKRVHLRRSAQHCLQRKGRLCFSCARRCPFMPTACALWHWTRRAANWPTACTTPWAVVSSSATKWQPTAVATKSLRPTPPSCPCPSPAVTRCCSWRNEHGLSIAQIMRRNEQHWRSDAEIDTGLLRIWQVMQDCVKRGCRTEGVLPGGFKVKRRAAPLFKALSANPEEACAIRCRCWTGSTCTRWP